MQRTTTRHAARHVPPAAGRVLEGVLNLGQLRRGPGAAPASIPFTYLTPPAAPGGGNGGKKDADAGKAPPKAPAHKVCLSVTGGRARVCPRTATHPHPAAAV